ncbi:DMT family transporter [Gordonia sp. HS-NH1]|uniref:DMT family transporter n=1 Tax=Gordonia sp. HS-NH1 TaxID=1435068 RepID=UPI0006E4257F|nr:DMT family transporter [Gordonia sp. HS-NH1]
MHTWVPALFAVFAALMIAAGTVLRQRASRVSGAITPGWWAGAAIALCGFGLQASALGLGSILLVQPLVVLAVLFALPLEAWADHRHPARVEWAWGGVLVACVVTFLIVARPEPSMRRPDALLLWSTVGAVIGVVVALVILAHRSSPHYKALFYGLLAGILFGVSALLVKTVIYQVTHHFWRTFVHPEIYLFVLVVVCAVIAQQMGFGAGDLQTSFPSMTVAEPAVAMVLGVLLLGENLKVSVPTALFLGIVLAIMVRAVCELAKLSAVRGWEQAVAAEESAAEDAAEDAAAEDAAAEESAAGESEAATRRPVA